MGLMIGDDRECAAAVTDLLLAQARPGKDKKADRQVEQTRTAYVFGHYDSRGGAALVLADNHIEALKKYMAAFFSCDLSQTDEDKEYVDGMIDAAQEDFIKRVQLVVCDEALPDEEAELDATYADEGGYLYGKVQSRYEQCDWDHDNRDAQGRATKVHTGKFSEWTDTDVFVMWKASPEEIEATREDDHGEEATPNAPALLMKGGVLEEEFRIVRENLGEDACGLVLIL